MKSAFFSALVWVSSTFWVTIASGHEEQMARTLQTWSIAVFLICVGMRVFWRDSQERNEPLGRQVSISLVTFSIFCLSAAIWAGTVRLMETTDLAFELATIGSLAIPGLALVAIMALEVSSLRSHAMAIGLVFASASLSFGLAHSLTMKKPVNPGLIRTRRPAHGEKWMHPPIARAS